MPELSRNTAIVTIRLVLTAVSFALYAAAVVTLHQDQTVAFVNEENGPLSAAVSHWLFGTPGGLIDRGVREYFLTAIRERVPTAEVVRQALDGAAPATGWPTIALDGEGIGDIVASELAFALFGPQAQSLMLLYLLLIGLSTLSFVLRYRDERMSAAPILLLALTLLLFTPLVMEGQNLRQAPIGGIRYYAVVGILPALHWCFEFGDKGIPGRYGGLARWGLLGVQLTVMALAILVRGSPFYLLLPLAASVWRALWRRNRGVGWRSTATYLCVPAVILVLCLGILPRLEYPDYAASGRLYVEVWHKIFVGFGTSPYFPFPGLREAYPCPDRGGLSPGIPDNNGLCVWWSPVGDNHLLPAEREAATYSGEYERVLRNAVFYVIRHYPEKVLMNILYYKPVQTVEAVLATWPSLSLPASRPILPLALLQIVLFIGFVAARPAPRPFRDAVVRLAVLLPFLISVQIPLLLAWARPWTIVDLLTFVLCGVEIAVWLALAYCLNLAIGGTELLLRVKSRSHVPPGSGSECQTK